MAKQKIDSIAKRYVFRLGASFVALLSNVLITLIVPRVLGPAGFGDYSFLYNFFYRSIGFLENGSSVALYTRMSQHNYDRTYLTFYFAVVGLLMVAVTLFILSVCGVGFSGVIWPQQGLKYVWLSFFVAAVIWFNTLLQKVADAHALTVHASLLQLVYRVVMMLALCALCFFSMLNLQSYFLFQLLSALFFTLLLCILFVHKTLFSLEVFHVSGVGWRAKLKDFWQYCSPLYVYGFACLLFNLVTLWLLQKFSGSVQQGYYGLGVGIASACFLFTNSVTSIFTREFAIAHGANDFHMMQTLFRRFIPLFYVFTSFFAIFCSVNAPEIANLVGGKAYAGAVVSIMIMSLYPIHQTYGQLVGSAYYASGNTIAYRNIGIFNAVLGVIFAYFFLAPHQYFGLHLGADGASLQLVLVQIFGVNLLAFYFAKRLKLRFRWFILHQVVVVVLLEAIAILVHVSVVHVLAGEGALLSLLISAVFYGCLVLFCIWLKPGIFGLTRDQVDQVERCVRKVVPFLRS